jgi:predicted amidohydrolase YtcJ
MLAWQEIPVERFLRSEQNANPNRGMGETHGAYAHFEERSRGSIEAGKLADLALLSRDILAVPTEEIRNITVDMTVVDGKVVHEVA